jgi:hypothetical protein
VRWTLALVIGLLVAGCGGGEEQAAAERETPTATATGTPEGRFEIAYKVPMSVARRLHKGEAYKLIREKGEVIARSDFDESTGYVLAAWLERRGIAIEDPGALTNMWLSVEKKQHLYLQIITADGAVADALDDLQPSKRRLAAAYNRRSQKRVPGAGEAMVDWLRIFRLAVREGDERNVVIIPHLH